MTDGTKPELSHVATFSCKGGSEMNSSLWEGGLCAQLKFDYHGKRRMNLRAPLADFAVKTKGTVY